MDENFGINCRNFMFRPWAIQKMGKKISKGMLGKNQ